MPDCILHNAKLFHNARFNAPTHFIMPERHESGIEKCQLATSVHAFTPLYRPALPLCRSHDQNSPSTHSRILNQIKTSGAENGEHCGQGFDTNTLKFGWIAMAYPHPRAQQIHRSRMRSPVAVSDIVARQCFHLQENFNHLWEYLTNANLEHCNVFVHYMNKPSEVSNLASIFSITSRQFWIRSIYDIKTIGFSRLEALKYGDIRQARLGPEVRVDPHDGGPAARGRA